MLLMSVAGLAPSALAQCPDGTPPPCRGQARSSTPVANSVAVLYFSTPDTADAYLADGFTEDIATILGHGELLQVKVPSSVRRAQQRLGDDAAGLGRALGVRYLVSGSVRRVGPRYRVAVRLVLAAAEVTRWGETYDRAAEALPDLPVTVSEAIAAAIRGPPIPSGVEPSAYAAPQPSQARPARCSVARRPAGRSSAPGPRGR